MTIEDYLGQLNEQQKEAVMINEGSLLVFAGAGSGKTRVITTKIAYAIESLGLRPYQILAVTLTNRACKEMQDRVVDMVGDKGRSVMIRTFHSFGVWLLRKYGSLVGLNENFKIYDDDDSVSLLSQCFPEENKKELAGYYKKISILKDKMERPNSLDERLVKFYNRYQEVLKRTGNVDFADMILKSIELLEKNPAIKQEVHDRFKMVLVDEYQDSNKAQFLLLKQLVGPETFICAVGDDDQSIYRFRGADVNNILDFPQAFANTQKVVLGTNYRCTENILAIAKDVIGNNKTRAQKSLNASNKGGSVPKLIYVENGIDEAHQVIKILEEARKTDDKAFEKSAILYRTNSQSKDFEDCLMMSNVPYHLVGSLRFYDREEIRDCIAMISLMTNPKDVVAFQRMVNKPARKIGDVTIDKLLALTDSDLSLEGDVIKASKKAVEQSLVRGPAVQGINDFLEAYQHCQLLFGTVDNGKFLKDVLVDFGILDYYVARDNDERLKVNKRTENIEQLVNMLSMDQFSDGQEGINNFLEFASLDPSSLGDDEGKSEEGVTLITMHNTKGLEYDRVFMVGMENEIFPGRLDERSMEDIEEERRICYVAMTRAKKELYMLCASSRLRWGNVSAQTPSMFIAEINKNHIEEKDLRLKARYGGNQFRFDNRGFEGFRPDRSKDRYSSHYVNTNAYLDDENRSSGPKPSEVGKYNIRNVTLIKKGSTSANPMPTKPVAPKTNSFNVGDRIRSDMYGEGTITGKRSFAGREVLDVKFDSGKTGTFASDKVTFEKIH